MGYKFPLILFDFDIFMNNTEAFFEIISHKSLDMNNDSENGQNVSRTRLLKLQLA